MAVQVICCIYVRKMTKMIFIGAVGALKPEFELRDLCTPSFSIAGGFAHTYLKDSIKDFVPFEKVELNNPLKMVHRSTEMPKCK